MKRNIGLEPITGGFQCLYVAECILKSFMIKQNSFLLFDLHENSKLMSSDCVDDNNLQSPYRLQLLSTSRPALRHEAVSFVAEPILKHFKIKSGWSGKYYRFLNHGTSFRIKKPYRNQMDYHHLVCLSSVKFNSSLLSSLRNYTLRWSSCRRQFFSVLC